MHIDAKAELGKRSILYWSGCLAAFIPWAVMAALLLPDPFQWGAYAIGIAVAYRVLFYHLEHRPLVIDCPKCKQRVATNTPWVCGFCKAENQQANEIPFIEPCGTCGAAPKAYKCHHEFDGMLCGGFIFLSEDKQERNHAYCLNTENAPPTSVTPSLTRAELKEQALHDVEIAKLKAELDVINKKNAPKEEKPVREQLRENFEKQHDLWLGAADEAAAQRTIAKEKYKDDADRLERALALIDRWEKEHLPQ
jgi:hypothetical protein